MAGFEIVAGVDNWRDALATFALNHPEAETVLADLSASSALDAVEDLPQPDVVVGGPPCQGFSIAGKQDPNDPRNRLYEGFLAVVRESAPKAFVMENVPNLASMMGGAVLQRILVDFRSLGYSLTWRVLLSSRFGVPQNRRRFFLVGTRSGPFEFPDGTGPTVTSSAAISDLPPDSLSDGSEYPSRPRSRFQEEMRGDSLGVWNHQITNHQKRTREIIAMVPDGGNYKDLPEELRSTRKVHIAWTRLASDRPSFTIDTGHRHHFHYQYNRIPTVRESARLQSFPDGFLFRGSKTSQYKQVGNAVPPVLAKRIASALASYLG